MRRVPRPTIGSLSKGLNKKEIILQFKNRMEILELYFIEVDQKSKNMRNKTQMQKRSVFIEWYINKFGNNKLMDDIIDDLTELLFLSRSTVKGIVFKKRN